MNLLTIVLTCSYVLGGSRHGLGSSMTWKPYQRKSRTGLFPSIYVRCSQSYVLPTLAVWETFFLCVGYRIYNLFANNGLAI